MGDWAAFATSLGVPAWNDGSRPCFLCNATRLGVHEHEGASRISFHCRENCEKDYDDACARCEVLVSLTARTQKLVVDEGGLDWDKRDDGGHGLCLARSVPELGLLKKDRLEPCDALPDVGAIWELCDFPPGGLRVVFWRSSRETMTRHRNPIFQESLGTSVWRSVAIGALHTLYLGVLLAFSRLALWKLILCGAYGGKGTQDEWLEIALQVLHNALTAWYKRRSRTHKTEQLTRINDVTKKMVGEPSNQKLGTKGAETWGLLLFLREELRRHVARLGGEGPVLAQAAESLVVMIEIFDSNGVLLPPACVQGCWDAYLRFLDLTQGYEDQLIPKRHLVLHMLRRLDHFGNPRFYAEWYDESLNKTLKGCCRKVSQATFELSVLGGMNQVLKWSKFARKRPAP